MNDFISTAFKAAVTYLFFYYVAVFVFGGAACMGCAGILKAAGEESRESPAASSHVVRP